eukprot:5971267-Pyramimonas_sp.AAC.1
MHSVLEARVRTRILQGTISWVWRTLNFSANRSWSRIKTLPGPELRQKEPTPQIPLKSLRSPSRSACVPWDYWMHTMEWRERRLDN